MINYKKEPVKKALDYLTTTEAMMLVGFKKYHITLPTLLTWCKKYTLGRKVGGRWYIDRGKFTAFLENGEAKNSENENK